MATPLLTWPFPQLLPGDTRNYLLLRSTTTARVLALEIASDWTIPMAFVLEESTYGTQDTRWSMAQVGAYTLLANGDVLVRRDPALGTYTPYTTSAPYSLIPVLNSLCNFKGQLVGCGVKSGWYGCDEASVVWSDIGSESMVPSRRNEAGFRRLPRGGTAYQVKRLGDVVICYSDREIAALVPKVEPAPTFALDEMLPLGLAGPGCVGGSQNEHLFVDKAGWVWRLPATLKLERLGYQEFMLQLDAANIVVSYDELEGDYYICDGTRCFLLTAHGMSEVHERISSLGVVNGTYVGYGASNGDTTYSVTIDTLDFGLRGLKSLETVEAGVHGDQSMDLRVHWRSERRQGFLQSPWRQLNAQGSTDCVTSGSDFRVQVRAAHFDGVYLDYLKLRWKMTDLRTLRGVYAPPTSARGQR